MNLNDHSKLAKALSGTHSFLSPSSPAWVNYDEDKLTRVFYANEAARRGTEHHAFAHDAIRLGIKLPDIPNTLNMYVNDAIGYGLSSEWLVFYSNNCYGHADAIGFRKNMLRIHDLKTGTSPADMRQLMIYAALFCLEYKMRPFDITIELRIYQNNQVQVLNPDADDVFHLMDRIITFDKRLQYLREESE
jgi:hypothetical protein